MGNGKTSSRKKTECYVIKKTSRGGVGQSKGEERGEGRKKKREAGEGRFAFRSGATYKGVEC